MKLAVLVGNASPRKDVSRLVDGADFVARFNRCSGFEGAYGSRTDRVYMCNTGGVARNLIKEHALHALIARSGAREVVFSYPRVTIRRFLLCFLHGKRRTALDRTNALTRALALQGLVCRRMPQEPFDAAIRFARQQPGFAEFERSTPLWVPSSGGVALMHLATEPDFSQYRIGLVGFGFQGWAGHPWFAEKAYAQRLAQSGRLVWLDEGS